MQKIAIVTGASTGIGKDTALRLAKRGIKVYAAARRVELIEAYANGNIIPVQMDVTNEKRIFEIVDYIIKTEGRIDILVNNAGYGSYGSIEEVPISEGMYQFDVNVFGTARLIQAVLPSMRKQKKGKIVNVSSVAGKIYEPLGSWYHSTKFAIEGMSDSLRLELNPHGIDVIIIEPGPILTEWNQIARRNLMNVSGHGPYQQQANQINTMLASYDVPGKGTPSDTVAKVIEKSIFSDKPKTRYPVGKGARALIYTRKIFGDKMVDRIFNYVLKNSK